MKTIHYIDDDRDDLEYFKFAVSQIDGDLTLHTHNDANAFMESCRRNAEKDPVIFLDINMPVKTGFQLLKEIRQHSEFSDLPVVMYSTSSDPTSISISKDLGADLYAVKPVDIREVISLIKRVINMIWEGNPQKNEQFVINV